jgi:hypothetical protein
MASTADPDEVRSFAAGLTDEYLECRTIGHLWRPFGADWKRDEQAYLVTYLCNRCNTSRHQWLDRFGDVVKGNYDYDEGYQHKGMGRIVGRGRSALRLESLTRIIGTRTPIKRAAQRPKEESTDGN